MSAFSVLTSYAEDKPVTPIWKKKTSNPGGLGGHAPMKLPINVLFDDASGILTVSAPEDMEGIVYVYTEDGRLEASSNRLNCSLQLSSSGLHILSLQGENWIGEAKFIF
ncbi:MAG: hypothetical protein K2H35_01220 [Muribaculaceae bacterium]|nr:hypothetical protein [Muribaculaceae bacterium]